MNWTEKLLGWYYENQRDLPWRKTKDPYTIWISEIILQQTTIKQGLSYYKKFINTYPNLTLLAKAKEEDVLKVWQGLGYYSRARNLHFTSKLILKEYNGVFPSNYSELIDLKGIGDYTASAIASICFNLPHAVVDGNVYRFLSRYFGIRKSINNGKSLKYFKNKASKLMYKENSGDFNQAMMEFGSINCKPKNPICENCLFNNNCYAYLNNKIYDFPIKNKNKKRRLRFFNFLIMKNSNNEIIVEKRMENDIWKNLYQFPLFEERNNVNLIKKIKQFVCRYDPKKLNKIKKWNIKPVKYKLTHQELYVTFWLENLNIGLLNKYNYDKLKKYPMPIALENFINKFFKLQT